MTLKGRIWTRLFLFFLWKWIAPVLFPQAGRYSVLVGNRTMVVSLEDAR